MVDVPAERRVQHEPGARARRLAIGAADERGADPALARHQGELRDAEIERDVGARLVQVGEQERAIEVTGAGPYAPDGNAWWPTP